MKLTKISDFFLVQWHTLIAELSGESERDYRRQSARWTDNRLKALKRRSCEEAMAHFDELPVEDFLPSGEFYLGENDPGTANVPALHQFRAVLGVDPVVPMTADREKPLSHISQYRLAVYVSGLTEQEKAIVYEDLAGSVQCA
jgi:hypothetical protein